MIYLYEHLFICFSMKFSALSPYERDVINRLIPLLPEQGSIPLHINLINLIFSDNALLLSSNLITHRYLGELVTEVSQNVIVFLIENDFIDRNADGSYEVLAGARGLCRAGSVEIFYGEF